MRQVLIYDDGYIPTSPKATRFKIIEYIIKDGCWECVSHKKDHSGYPVMSARRGYGNGKNGVVHISRVVYMRENYLQEEDLRGLVIRHSCDNPSCINPMHLSVGTQKDNIDDMIERNRQSKGSATNRATLTEKDVYEIKYFLIEKKLTHKQISEKYGVSRDTIGKISRGETWSHIVVS